MGPPEPQERMQGVGALDLKTVPIKSSSRDCGNLEIYEGLEHCNLQKMTKVILKVCKKMAPFAARQPLASLELRLASCQL